MHATTLKRSLFFIIIILIPFISACSENRVFLPTLTSTPPPTPTETPVPPAAMVNGEEITKTEFDAELARYQQAQAGLGNTVSPEKASQIVLSDMVNSLLMAQGAASAGLVVDDATVQARIDALATQVGGSAGLTAWETAHGYGETDFRFALKRQMEAALMRDKIIASVPNTAEQVHVKQILLYNSADAQQALGNLQAGASFNDLAAQYDPLTKGELGWFPRGYLPSSAIEEAAFALQPGQYSGIIQDETGFHILYIEERDPARLLSPDALLTLQGNAVVNWLTQRQKESTIVLTP